MTDPVKWIAEADHDRKRLRKQRGGVIRVLEGLARKGGASADELTVLVSAMKGYCHDDPETDGLLDTAPTEAEVRRVGLAEAERLIARHISATATRLRVDALLTSLTAEIHAAMNAPSERDRVEPNQQNQDKTKSEPTASAGSASAESADIDVGDADALAEWIFQAYVKAPPLEAAPFAEMRRRIRAFRTHHPDPAKGAGRVTKTFGELLNDFEQAVKLYAYADLRQAKAAGLGDYHQERIDKARAALEAAHNAPADGRTVEDRLDGGLIAEHAVGAQVEKYTGDYHLAGEVRSSFLTKAGKLRYVVEHEPGFLHIYGPSNIRALVPADESAQQPTGAE